MILSSFIRVVAVPYAFYAAEAGSVADDEEGINLKKGDSSIGMLWSLKGNDNSGIYNTPPLMGTTDYNPISFITDDIERLRITEDGEILINGNVDGSGNLNLDGSATIKDDLIVRNNVSLNTLGGNTKIYGRTIIGGPGMNFARFTGNVHMNKMLTVNGATNLFGTLGVTGATTLEDALTVDGATNLNSTLDVNNGSATNLSGTLSVTGATTINNQLNVTEDVVLEGDTKIDGETIIGGLGMNATLFTGDVYMNKKLAVNGATNLNSTLDVNNGSATNLSGTLGVIGATNLEDAFTVGGVTNLNNSLNVNNTSPTSLSGTLLVREGATLQDVLTVGGVTNLNSSLNVNNTSPTSLSGTLLVREGATLQDVLTVDGATNLNSTLDVNNGSATNLSGTLAVTGATTISNQLNITKDVVDGSFLATMHNTNNGDGDGLNIKLGKNRTEVIAPPTPELLTPDQINDIKNLIRFDFPAIDKPELLVDIVAEGLLADVEMVAGLAVGIGNLLIDFLNTELDLPIDFPEIEVPAIDVPAIDVPSFEVDVPVIPTFNLPSFTVTSGFNIFPETVILPSFEIFPEIPEIDLSAIGIPGIEVDDLDFWGIPNICLDDGGTNPLNNENEFIRFSDNDDVKMGSIRAVSVSDWSREYLTPIFLFKLHGAFTSAVDKKHAKYHFKSEISTALKDYASIGVEYSSGNGDYAEWLERSDLEESISPGDIVAVKGGKISKDLENAEQVMVVSHNPIVLGNIPPDNKVHLGNNVAFMGQVPVKITGPVSTGDYIIANPAIPGYGFAKSQNEMTVEDFKYAVGRAWEESLITGPKMINTVVGIHNGDYFKVLKNYESKLQVLEEKAQATSENLLNLESKVDEITKALIKPLASK